jgi:hypothetical protein
LRAADPSPSRWPSQFNKRDNNIQSWSFFFFVFPHTGSFLFRRERGEGEIIFGLKRLTMRHAFVPDVSQTFPSIIGSSPGKAADNVLDEGVYDSDTFNTNSPLRWAVTHLLEKKCI